MLVFELISGFECPNQRISAVCRWMTYTQTSQMPTAFLTVQRNYVYGNRMPANTASMSDVPVALSVSSLISQNIAPPSAC